ncbi:MULTISPECIES: hypothetical protein [Rhizobium]|nr:MULTISPECIES: hypothetical protein [Rhizobium]MCA0802866.1 hypothetical protein [Rhizobium sp. T1473]MCS0461287.1 hypothetical protein [Rhizobium favelukesii]UFS83571.1 hypothetical protein LPB79_15270 [Rhizobium sp. T136]
MKVLKSTAHLLAAISVLMLVSVPILGPSPAEAGRAAACGPRGCAAAGCGPSGCAAGAVRRPPGYRPVPHRGVVVVAPHRYWRPGGAIAAGAAIGFVAGATAASIAGTPPKPGYCWYYTTPAKTTGFWDVCPS